MSTTVTRPSSISSSSSSSPSPSPSSRPRASFLSLAVETRLQIYGYLLTLPTESLPRSLWSPSWSQPSRSQRVHAAILRVNRQINTEATPSLYAANTWLAAAPVLTAGPRLRLWYRPVHDAAVLPRIRRFHMIVHLDCEAAPERARVAQAFSGVEELELELAQAMYMRVGCENLTAFDRVRGVGKARIRGCTAGFEDYIAWLEAAMTSDPSADIPEFYPPPVRFLDQCASK